MGDFNFLNKYPQKEKDKLERLWRNSIGRLPSSLSILLQKFADRMDKEEYDRAMSFARDFFDMYVQYLSCVLIALIQNNDAQPSPANPEREREIQKSIRTIDDKRPLTLGSWVDSILLPLLNEAKTVIPKDPLYNRLINCKINNVLNGKKSGQPLHDRPDKYEISNELRGDRPKLAEIRNYFAHKTTPSEDTYQEIVVETVEPRISSMLNALTPLQEWSYYSCLEIVEPNREYRVELMNGCEPREPIMLKTAQILEVSHYYLCQNQPGPEAPVLIDLFPLVFCHEANSVNSVYVIQTLEKYEKISYISSNGEPVTQNRWNQELNARLQKTLKTFSVAKNLNLEEIKEFAGQASRGFLERAYRGKKYDYELFVERSALSAVLGAFKQSEKQLFPLLGEAGTGKTNQLCYWTEQMTRQGDLVIIFNSAEFAESSLGTQLLEIFGFGGKQKKIDKQLTRLLANVHETIKDSGKKLYFFFDALNECLRYKCGDEVNDGAKAAGPLKLYSDIRKFLINDLYPCFKVLFTCRIYTWKNLIRPHIPPEDLPVMFLTEDEEDLYIRGFTQEELAKAYEMYRELYQMKTPFSDLSKNSAIRLRDPLVLKFACTNYLGADLPSTALPYTSIELFGKMLRDVAASYAGSKQVSILRELTLYILDEYENKDPSDNSIAAAWLRDAYHDKESRLNTMAGLVYKNDADTYSVAFRELLDKPERPVLRLEENEAGEERFQFVYERFLEFMLALVFVERERAGLPERENIPAGVFVDRLKVKERTGSVVFMGMLRNALLMDYTRTGNPSVILELVGKHGDNPEIMLLLSETINVLIRENYEAKLFGLIDGFLNQQNEADQANIQAYNAAYKTIESNQANDRLIHECIRECNELRRQLAPIIRLRKMAVVSVVNGMFLTDYFNEDEGTYRDSSFGLLRRLITDSLIEVRNAACHYAYYLSNRIYTHEHLRLKENLAQRIIRELFMYVNGTNLRNIFTVKKRLKHSLIFAEAAGRLSVLLLIDAMMAGDESGGRQKAVLLNEIKATIKHVTFNHRLFSLAGPLLSLPFIKSIIIRQGTFQAAYVNNLIEYQTFWDKNVIPVKCAAQDEWSHECLREILIFFYHNNESYKKQSPAGASQDASNFSQYHERILSAYKTGDSFSYFVLERVMAIMGIRDWKFISPVIDTFFNDANYRDSAWYRYSQMSMLYVLCQVTLHNRQAKEAIIPIYHKHSKEWTINCKGLFPGQKSAVANPTGKYKRNVMTWYCMAYCAHAGDYAAWAGDVKPVPAFYELIDYAVSEENSDKELLYHLLENISELVTESGEHIKTALELIKYIMEQFKSQEKVDKFDDIPLERAGVYQDDLITAIGKVLSTAKNRYNTVVDDFIVQDLAGLDFPGIPRYRGDILNYNPIEETLSDLFTHKFGNFLIWGLLNEEAIDKTSYDIITASVDSADCFKWFDKVVHICVPLLKIS